MNNRFYILALICILALGCQNEDFVTITRYQGMVLEQSEKQPIEGVLTMLTDGINVFDSTRTAVDGQFYLTANWNIMNDSYYLFIDGEGRYPSKKVDLIGTKKEQFDFFYLYLYDKQSIDAAPDIFEEVTIQYIERQLVFRNITINSPYTLTETSLLLIDGAGRESRYPLTNNGGNYSVSIDGLTIGEWYQWAIYAENEVDYTMTSFQDLLYGFQNITILPITNASTSSIAVSCLISGESPYPTEAVGLCWGKDDNPSMTNSVNATIINNAFSEVISNIDFTITTYIWAYIRNQSGIAYSRPLVLSANNPLDWFEFEYDNYTYSVYEFHEEMNWYQAVNACENLDVCFDDWAIPNYLEVAAYVSAYIQEYQVLPYTNIWSSRRELYFEEGESETFLSTPNGLIMESKQNKHSVVAVRKY